MFPHFHDFRVKDFNAPKVSHYRIGEGPWCVFYPGVESRTLDDHPG